MTNRPTTSWFLRSRVPASSGEVTTVVFPHAAASPSLFRGWLSPGCRGVDAWVAALPGRGARLDELPITSFEPLVEALLAELAPTLPRRYALFGHSLGAYLAFEVARRLPREPVALFVSGAAPPQQRRRADRPRADMSDAELVEELRRLGGTPWQVLGNPELLELLMPSIRADFEVADSYAYEAEPKLRCPLYALGGQDDQAVPVGQLSGWLEQTHGRGQVATFPGGHFYVHDREGELMAYVGSMLQPSPVP